MLHPGDSRCSAWWLSRRDLGGLRVVVLVGKSRLGGTQGVVSSGWEGLLAVFVLQSTGDVSASWASSSQTQKPTFAADSAHYPVLARVVLAVRLLRSRLRGRWSPGGASASCWPPVRGWLGF